MSDLRDLLFIDLLNAARRVCHVMTNGFISPEDESDEFARGWDAACEEFRIVAHSGPVGMSLAEVLERIDREEKRRESRLSNTSGIGGNQQ